MNNQPNSKIRKKSFTKLFNKIIFPLNINPHQSISQHELLHQSQKLKESNQNSQISKIKRTNPKKQSFSQLNKLIEQFEKRDRKQFLSEFNPFGSLTGKNSQSFKSQKKYRSLTKSRSLTVNNQYDKNGISLNESNTEQKSQLLRRKRLKSSKHRSLTKMESDWMKDRNKQREKQFVQIHKFDQQKIDRNYDHLGKLRKKTTHNKQQIKSRFASFKNIPKELSQIDKQTFENARKDFNKKFKTYVVSKEIQEQSQFIQRQQELSSIEEKDNTSSPKVAKKNFLKINPLYNMYKKQNSNGIRKKGEKKIYRVSADQQLLKFGLQIDNNSHKDIRDNNQFYSENQYLGLNDENDTPNKKLQRKQSNQIDENLFEQQQLNLDRPRVSENQQTSIFDKVYFFSLKLSSGQASLFTIERINLKSRHGRNFIIEQFQVVICAYQEILVQRIKFDKRKQFQTIQRLKPDSVDKNYEKDKLKSELFAELMARREELKNKESLPVSVELNSQKTNFQRSPSQRLPHSQNKNLSIQSIEHHYEENQSFQKLQNMPPSQQLSSMNFTKVSAQSYQLIIDYLQKFCQLEISYLGVSLKEVDSQGGMLNQIMKKKHSQMQETLLESLNLAKVFYFLIKINATYYVSKSVIIANRKIKHYLLYEFSNMIRHEQGCIIEEEEEINKSVKKMRDKQLVQWLYFKVNRFFTYSVFRRWKQKKHISPNEQNQILPCQSNFDAQKYPLINALQICFGSLTKVGLKCQYSQIDSDQLFRITQSNFKNEIKWKKIQFQINQSNEQKNKENHQPFFVFHNAFDFGITTMPRRESLISYTSSQNRQSYFLNSPLSAALPSKQPPKLTQIFSYTINRNFLINIALFPSVIKSRNQIVNLHVRTIKDIKIQDQFRKEQFALLHIGQYFDNNKPCQILQEFLKQQYIRRIVRNNRRSEKPQNKEQQHLFTIIKNKKYHIHVFMYQSSKKDPKYNILHQKLKIQAQSRLTVRHYTLQLTIGDIFDQIKEFYRLYSDSMSYHKFSQTLKRIRTHGYQLTKDLIIDRVKFYVSKLLLMKKNTYSQFYFVPLPKLVSEASFKASSVEKQKQPSSQEKSIWASSILISAAQKQLIFQTLQKLQNSLQQKQKHSLSTISKIKIKNFPVYEIYYKTVKKLIPGHFVIVSIYYMPMFDLSQVKVYVNRIRKSFWTPVRRDVGTGDFEKIVDGVVQFVKEKYFSQIIQHETQKLSSKYRDFYSKMIKQAQTAFLSKARKNKETLSSNSNLNLNFKSNLNRRRQRQPTRHNSLNPLQITELTEELLCKMFHSPRKNKYIIRLSYPATGSYVHQQERKGIDELINISVLKQNCMLIYKFQTTARKLLAKKVTHKFNVIQLEYQQKIKPFYILFQQIKTLITKSDQTTYGLLNTFRGYFLNKHYNNLTTTSFVSMLSLNLLAGATIRNLQQNQNPSSFLQNNTFDKPQNYPPQNKLVQNLKSNKYQRYCLFVENNKVLEVLKIRDKFQKKSLKQSDRIIPSAKSQTTNLSKQFVRRRKERKQSIEAFLTQKNNFLQSSIRSSHKNAKSGEKFQNHHQPHNVDFIMQESYHINEHSASEQKIVSNYEEKMVYLIDKETEAITEVQSSIQDQGFMINVPFGMYNRKMFKRFFKHLLLVREEKEAYENKVNASYDNLHSTSSVLQVPLVHRNSLRMSNFSSQPIFQ